MEAFFARGDGGEGEKGGAERHSGPLVKRQVSSTTCDCAGKRLSGTVVCRHTVWRGKGGKGIQQAVLLEQQHKLLNTRGCITMTVRDTTL